MSVDRVHELRELIAPLVVSPGRSVHLARDFDPAFYDGQVSKDGAAEALAWSIELLSDYQIRLAAQDHYGLLVVIQAIDAAGKDSTIKHVMSGVNPQGVDVHSFKVPSQHELDHDFLWRYQQALPERGKIAIFNRSHYEEVLVVRVHPELLVRQHLPPEAVEGDVWSRRYQQINRWEHYLVDNGIRVVKLFLNVSKGEQRRRFLDRIDDPTKHWKFSAADVAERAHWDAYQQAFEAMLSHTSTEWAPWHVIPADHKWFARLAAAAVITNELVRIDPQFPVLDDAARTAMAEARRGLQAEG